MKLNEIIAYLKSNGWKCRRDEAGDHSCVKVINDRQIVLIPHLSRRRDHIIFSLIPWVSTEQFSYINAALMNEKAGQTLLPEFV